MKPRVVCTGPFPGTALARLAAHVDLWVGPEEGTPREQLLREGREAEGLICGLLSDRIDAGLLAGLPKLRIVATPTAGTDHIDLGAARERGLWVCHVPEATTEATADLAFALILAVARRVVEGDRLVRSGGFHSWRSSLLLGVELSGAVLGVIGAGRIGQAVLRRGAGFGMALRYTRLGGPLPALAGSFGARFQPLPELLAESDVVSLHVPLRPETRHLIDAAALARMRRDAILVNTSRGPVVDEAALAAALSQGRLRGAGIDVFEHEPDVHPGILASDRVVLTPHVGSATEATRARMIEGAVAAVEAVLLDHGEPRGAVVRPAKGLELPKS